MAKASKRKPASKKKAAPRKKTNESAITMVNLNNTISSIPARLAAVSVSANVGVTFFGGVGTATVALFRGGLLINMQTITASGSVNFSDVAQFDRITVDGVGTGTGANATVINISVPTSPATPTNFPAGEFHIGYIVI
ncbi:MAG: hypothetical protein QM781_19095 [Chitinophagaceae bacterium]